MKEKSEWAPRLQTTAFLVFSHFFMLQLPAPAAVPPHHAGYLSLCTIIKHGLYQIILPSEVSSVVWF